MKQLIKNAIFLKNILIIDKDVFYKDLYFKDKVKTLILKNRKKDKDYKISIYKYNQSVKGDLTNYWIERFNIDNISEIDNIDKLIPWNDFDPLRDYFVHNKDKI